MQQIHAWIRAVGCEHPMLGIALVQVYYQYTKKWMNLSMTVPEGLTPEAIVDIGVEVRECDEPRAAEGWRGSWLRVLPGPPK